MNHQENFEPGDTVLIDGRTPGSVIQQRRQYLSVQTYGSNGTIITIDVVNGRETVEKQVCPFCGCKSLSALFFLGGTFNGFVCDNLDCKKLSDPDRKLSGIVVL
jgi:hypothetical protein